MSYDPNAFFPPYMNSTNEGNQHSAGMHVVGLQFFLDGLIIGGKINAPLIPITGMTDEATANAVKALQRELGMSDVDGNFGQGTREALLRATSFNFNTIPGSIRTIQGIWIDPDGNLKPWPPAFTDDLPGD